MSRGVEWVGPIRRPQTRTTYRVERHPARARDGAERFGPLQEPLEVQAMGQSFRLDQLPYLLAYSEEKAVAALALALHEDDLALLGYGLFKEAASLGAGSALLAEAVRIGNETGRRRLVAPVTNADILALFFLQTQAFAITGMRPYSGPPRQGAAGLAATQELLLVRPLA